MRGDQKKYNFIFGIDDMALAVGIPALLGTGVDTYNSLKGGDASSKTTVNPAAMTGDQARINNEFQESAFGGFDPIWYMKNNPDLIEDYNLRHHRAPISADTLSWETAPKEVVQYATKHYERFGKGEGRPGVDPASVKTYEEKIAEDNSYQKAVDLGLISDQQATIDQFKKDLAQTTAQKVVAGDIQNERQTQNTTDLINSLTGANQKWNQNVQPVMDRSREIGMSAPIMLSVGGQGTPIMSSTQRDMLSRYTDLNDSQMANNANFGKDKYNANTSLYDTIKNNQIAGAGYQEAAGATNLGLDTTQNNLVNTINRQYTPNRDANDYQNWLQALNQSNDALRYGATGQTTNASIPGGGAITPAISGMTSIIDSIMKQYGKKNETVETPSYNFNNAAAAFPNLFGNQ